MSSASHRDLILDQFTRQATPFSTARTIASEEALRMLVTACGAGPDDTVLDVACGGGLVVCAFARWCAAPRASTSPRQCWRGRAPSRRTRSSSTPASDRATSYVRAMPAAELTSLFAAAGLPEPRRSSYELRDKLENRLARSFPNPGDDDKIRALFRASLIDDRLGIPIRAEGDDDSLRLPRRDPR